MATTAQFTSIRVVCNNTLSIAVSDTASAVKVPHRSKFDAQSVKKALGISVSHWDEFMYRMKLLSERKINTRESQAYFLSVLTDTNKLTITPHEKNKVMQVMDLYNGQGMGSLLASANGTAYGLLNAVTQFVDHEQRAKSQDNRLNSAWFGQGSSLKNKALDEALLLAA